MNSVYRRLRSEFMAEETYEGSDIHAVILDVIKVMKFTLFVNIYLKIMSSVVDEVIYVFLAFNVFTVIFFS